MATVQIKVPSPGESVTEGRIAKWFKQTGEAVKVDDPLFELESDKAAQTVTAQQAGVLKVTVPEGEIVAIGAVVAEIDTEGKPSAAPASGDKPANTGVKGEQSRDDQGRYAPDGPVAGSPAKDKAQAAPTEEPNASPAARRVLAERGLTAAQVTGSGPKGLVTKEDAEGHKAPAPSNGTPPAPAPSLATGHRPLATARETRQPLSMIRRRIAERLLESQNSTATLTTFNEADMSAVMDLRARYNEKFEKKHGVKLGFMSVFVKAVIDALKAFPVVNSRLDGNDLVQQHFYDISVAVSTEKGLTVPVIREADQLGFADIEKKIAELAKKAKDGKLTPQDMMGGTFTITNGGTFGSMMSTPILNPPQCAILGMHAINKRPVAVGDEIEIRPMMYLALSYDHRIIDGREAVQFLVRVKECVENPERMLFGI